ncbi:MAG: hypothetical protein IH828_08830 [Nitrospinae bacterium]|nr:hypothetical protein [Nitrospinota bacterium]MCH7769017.1 hypothetical protein [Nitrospinota bacterium]
MSPDVFRWVLTAFLSLFSLLWGAIGTILLIERQNMRENFQEVKSHIKDNHAAISTLRAGMARDFVLRTEYLGNVGRLEARVDGVKEALDRHLGSAATGGPPRGPAPEGGP